jgi:hypothetical protein
MFLDYRTRVYLSLEPNHATGGHLPERNLITFRAGKRFYPSQYPVSESEVLRLWEIPAEKMLRIIRIVYPSPTCRKKPLIVPKFYDK